MDPPVRDHTTKSLLKKLPIWEYLCQFNAQAEQLHYQINNHLEELRKDCDQVDEIPEINTSGTIKIRPPRVYHDIDLVKFYERTGNGELIYTGQKILTETRQDCLDQDPTIKSSLRLLEERPRSGERVFAMIKEKEPWVECVIKSVEHKQQPNSKKRFTTFKLVVPGDNKTIQVDKFFVARSQNHGLKLRVSKRIIAGPSESQLMPGIIGQDPAEHNKFRYLVLFDDGQARYFGPDNVFPIFYQSTIPWQDARYLNNKDLFVEAELVQFFKTYPRRHILHVRPGDRINLSRRGVVVPAAVIKLDCDTMQVVYKDCTQESIFRGSSRCVRKQDFIGRLVSKSISLENLYYKLPGLMRSYHEAGLTALGGDLRFVEDFGSKLVISGNTARKSTASRSPKKPSFRVEFSDDVVDDDRESRPELQDLIDDTHKKCTPECLEVLNVKTEASVIDIVDEFRNVSDVKIPLLLGWKRILVKNTSKVNGKFRLIHVYRAPCGKIFQTMLNIRRYIQNTGSKLDVDYFTFDPNVDLKRVPIEVRAFLFNKNIARDKNSDKPLENKHISLMNQFDEEQLPFDFEYSSESVPHPCLKQMGFTFNQEFKSSCDCEDDCNTRPSCHCHQLTEQIYGSNYHGRGLIDTKCQYKDKRLKSQVSTGIYECNSFCSCSSKCPNRVVQNGIKFRLQVRKTIHKGWGVVTLDDIPEGAFISTYSAELLDDADRYGDCDMYFADLDYISVVERQKLAGSDDERSDEGVDLDEDELERGGGGGGRGGDNDDDDDDDESAWNRSKKKSRRPAPVIFESSDSDVDQGSQEFEEFMPQGDSSRYPKRNRNRSRAPNNLEQPSNGRSQYKRLHQLLNESCDYTLDARMQGNIGRFFNHSCDPNSFVQNVFIETHDPRFPVVAFFAKRTILAGEEITWNYNYKVGSIEGRVLKCNCGAPNCKGRIL